VLLLFKPRSKYERSFKSQYNELSDLNKQRLKENFVIIKGDIIFVDTEKITGIELSDVIINKDLIKDDEERFYISHLIRNILIDGAVIENYDEKGNDFAMSPCVNVDSQYIVSHKDNIIKVLYYLLHKDYFNLYEKLQSSGEKIFNCPQLEAIKDDLKELKDRLINEKAIEFVTVEIPDQVRNDAVLNLK
jgi:hypothetical protein